MKDLGTGELVTRRMDGCDDCDADELSSTQMSMSPVLESRGEGMQLIYSSDLEADLFKTYFKNFLN
jgi:hypothetical protein